MVAFFRTPSLTRRYRTTRRTAYTPSAYPIHKTCPICTCADALVRSPHNSFCLSGIRAAYYRTGGTTAARRAVRSFAAARGRNPQRAEIPHARRSTERTLHHDRPDAGGLHVRRRPPRGADAPPRSSRLRRRPLPAGLRAVGGLRSQPHVLLHGPVSPRQPVSLERSAPARGREDHGPLLRRSGLQGGPLRQDALHPRSLRRPRGAA